MRVPSQGPAQTTPSSLSRVLAAARHPSRPGPVYCLLCIQSVCWAHKLAGHVRFCHRLTPNLLAETTAVYSPRDLEATPSPRPGAAAGRSNPTSKERWLRGRRRAERSYSTFKVRRSGREEIPLVQGNQKCWTTAENEKLLRNTTAKQLNVASNWKL